MEKPEKKLYKNYREPFTNTMLLEFLPTPNLSKESSLTKPSRMVISLLTSLKTNVINFSHLFVRLPVRERVMSLLLTLI